MSHTVVVHGITWHDIVSYFWQIRPTPPVALYGVAFYFWPQGGTNMGNLIISSVS